MFLLLYEKITQWLTMIFKSPLSVFRTCIVNSTEHVIIVIMCSSNCHMLQRQEAGNVGSLAIWHWSFLCWTTFLQSTVQVYNVFGERVK